MWGQGYSGPTTKARHLLLMHGDDDGGGSEVEEEEEDGDVGDEG